jgi:hypothetical protein
VQADLIDANFAVVAVMPSVIGITSPVKPFANADPVTPNEIAVPWALN